VLTLRVKRSGRRHSFQTFHPPPAKRQSAPRYKEPDGQR
jgi:hypothetical protein